jgi:Flp pilus assembly protein TadB
MTANVRASGAILSLIPLGLGLALWFISPDYIGTFFAPNDVVPQPACGIVAVAVIVGMISAGYFVMMKIADIEV